MDFKIIDAHFHLWFRQDTEVDGMPIRTLFNGRSLFMGRRTADGSVFMIDGRNRAEVFCQIWIMHKFRQLLLHKSLSMVFRTGTWLRWHENIPTAFSYAACASTSSCHGIKLFRQNIQIKYFLQKELDIRGSCNALPADFRAVICYMKQGTCPKDEFISKVATPETAL